MPNPFDKKTGADRLYNPFIYIVIFGFAVAIGIQISKGGIVAAIVLAILPIILYYFNKVFINPKIALMTVVVAAFFINGLGRYIPQVQWGLTVDGLLVISLIAIILKNFYKGVDWSPMMKEITALCALWMFYDTMQLANPEAQSFEAWFYTMRGIALYFFLGIPLGLMLFRHPKDLNWIFLVWGALAILASLKGFYQLNIGLDSYEKAWLDRGAASTHILFGKLRVFSFMSDAGQFGAMQGNAGVVASIIALRTKIKRQKIFFIFVALLSFYGMMISGTRGAIAIPFAGFFLYLILVKNIKLTTAGMVIGIMVFVFFKYTTIGQGNYQINRMRTAFDPNDASFQTRLRNQRTLKTYLASRPLGGGIGHAGVRAQKYVPNGFLANIATDSWYVLIWAEQGAVGLTLHFYILFFIVIKGAYIIMFRIRDHELQTRLMAFLSGFFGILLANYGNAVMGQLPTSILTYFGIALVFGGEHFDEVLEKEKIDITGKPV